MNLLCPSYVRRKAVWGPKRIVWPLLLILLGFTRIASAQGQQTRLGSGQSSHAKSYQLDDELERRANDPNGSVNTSSVIAELVPGAKLPPEFKHYLRRFAVGGDDNLSIINGVLLD